MNPLLITNRDFTLPGDGWFHVVPLGEFPHPSGVIQVIDARATESMVNRFRAQAKAPNFPGMLVDFDHFSDDAEKQSEAAGWIDDLQNRADGVWGHIRFSDSGEAAVKGGRYRLVSPVFSRTDADVLENAKRLRPLRLLKVALTNDPNLRGMVPLSNRDAEKLPAAEQSKIMKNLMQKLGLSADASEEAAIEAVLKLQNRADEAEAMQNRNADLQKQNDTLQLEQINHDLDMAGVKEESKRAKLIPVLVPMKNRKDREDFLKEVLPPKAARTTTATLHNRQTAGTPTESFTQAVDEAARAQEIESKIQTFKLANRCSYSEARNAVRLANPQLFGLTK